MDRRFSGTVLVRAGAQRLVTSRGWADREQGVRNAAATRFNTASITKLFTAVAVCRLVEAGVLDLDDTVADVLPGAELPAASEMKLRQLLVHTAGFPEEAPDPETGGPGGWIDMARTPLAFRPGRGWSYSNIGYAVLGACLERASGRTYYEAVDDLVFRPVGMTATAFDDPELPTPGRAASYADGEGTRRRKRVTGLERGGPYGYAYSTVGDLERLLDAITSASIVEPQHASQILSGTIATSQAGRWAGFGMFAEAPGGVAISTLSGAGPGVSSWLDLAPSRGYLAIVLSNLPKPAAHRVGEALRSAHLS